MAVNNYSFIEEAERALNSGSTEEITYRNAVSRAYYGLYHCALAHADTLLKPPLSACGGGSHKKVSDFYKVQLAKTREETLKFRSIGYKLLQLHSQRIKSDYHLHLEVFKEDAEAMITITKALHQSLVDLGAAA
jgi:uncharacterized protein (UPF0332 family)